MVENSPSSIDNASEMDLVNLIIELGDPLFADQISFPILPGIEELSREPASTLKKTRLKCHIARIIEKEDPVYSLEQEREDPAYFRNLKKTESFLKGRGF